MATRVKVVCNYKNSQPGWNQLAFSPVVTGSEENKRFFAATPGGQFSFYTINDEAAAQFEMGKEYYFDIFAADAQPSAPSPATNVVEIQQPQPAQVASAEILQDETQDTGRPPRPTAEVPQPATAEEPKAETPLPPASSIGYEIAGQQKQS